MLGSILLPDRLLSLGTKLNSAGDRLLCLNELNSAGDRLLSLNELNSAGDRLLT